MPTKQQKSIKIKVKGGERSRNASFLGEYDRELDGDTSEPLHFEEQFILRVPREVAVGKGDGTGTGLRELAKGKGKGLDGVEFKFLGECACGPSATADGTRSKESRLPFQRQDVRVQAG